MKINSLVFIGLCCLSSSASFSQQTITVEISLSELIKTYTDEHEANIVYKPSLNRTVKVVEEDLTGIDTSTFLDLLTRNGLGILERDGIVFIISVEDAVTRGDRFEGWWRDRMKSCAGYRTQVETEDFCAKSAPENWVLFEFNGQTYYRIPLDGN